MVTHGQIKNGVVVLDNGTRLPEGQQVIVLAPSVVSAPAHPHSILDIPAASVGAVLRPPTPEDDLLGEMLDGEMLDDEMLDDEMLDDEMLDESR